MYDSKQAETHVQFPLMPRNNHTRSHHEVNPPMTWGIVQWELLGKFLKN